MSYHDVPSTDPADRRFIRRAMRVPLLAREREFELARRWREESDEGALHELVSAYTRLVVSTASRFRHYGLPMADLIQEGCVGLMLAAARFEPERQIRFSTYATWWVRSAMQECVLRNWSLVRMGSTAAQKSLFFSLRRLRAQIEGASAANLSAEGRAEVARRLKVSEGDVEMMEQRLAGNDRSLNNLIGEDGDAEWLDLIADDRAGPEEIVLQAEDSATRADWLERAIGTLSPREQMIIRERRLREDSVTLETLGGELGISKERVRQIEHQALRKLRIAIVREVGDPAEAGLITG